MGVAALHTPPSASPLLNGERLYSPAALAEASNIPGHRGGKHLNGSTIFRHITKGCRAANGEVIRLEAVRIGNRWLTSLEALSRFSQALTKAAIPVNDDTSPKAPTPKQLSRTQAAASAELDAILGANK